ncbi:MAG: hypothetical protein ACOY3N_09010 [Bradyrhizobium sp.]|uniref:hypothetical protein n=1 Tax=Bradyrhizobium sp. TaxID=376 RepID=UPI003BF2DBFD
MTDRGDLQRIVDTFEAGGELSEEQRRLAAAALRQALMPSAPTIRRDELLREMKRRFYPTHRLRAASLAIAEVWEQYEIRAWPHDSSAVTCPPRHVGKPQELLWRIMRDWPNSLGKDRIRQILTG